MLGIVVERDGQLFKLDVRRREISGIRRRHAETRERTMHWAEKQTGKPWARTPMELLTFDVGNIYANFHPTEVALSMDRAIMIVDRKKLDEYIECIVATATQLYPGWPNCPGVLLAVAKVRDGQWTAQVAPIRFAGVKWERMDAETAEHSCGADVSGPEDVQ